MFLKGQVLQCKNDLLILSENEKEDERPIKRIKSGVFLTIKEVGENDGEIALQFEEVSFNGLHPEYRLNNNYIPIQELSTEEIIHAFD